MPGETFRVSTRDVQRLGSTLKLIATRCFLAGCRRRHSALASSTSTRYGTVAQKKFILGSDSLRACCPKRRDSGRTFVVSVRGVLRGSLVLVESRLASLVVIWGGNGTTE